MNKENSLLQGGITRSLVVFTMPILFALLLQVTYGMVDMLIVGNFASIRDISAVSTGSQLISTLTSLCTGLAMGTTILIGQRIGESREDDIGPAISNSIILFLSISLLLMGIILIFKQDVLDLMNTPSDARFETGKYIFYSAIGIPMIFSYNVLGSIFRGLGDSKTPLIAVAIACVVNIIGDFILVAGFNLGAAGAAIATVVAQTTSLIVSLWIIKKRKLFNYDMRSRMFNIRFDLIKKVVVLGTPIAFQSVLTSISFLFITVIVNKFGVIFSASVGITEKLVGAIMLLPLSFMQSMSVFVAQNYGAKNFTRIRRGLVSGIVISFVFGLFTAYLAIFQGKLLISIFNSDLAIIDAASDYMKAYAIDTLFVPVLFCLTGYLNGCGRTMYAMIHGVIGAIGIRLTLTYFFSTIEPVSLFNIGLATPSATLVQIVMCIFFYIVTERQIRRSI